MHPRKLTVALLLLLSAFVAGAFDRIKRGLETSLLYTVMWLGVLLSTMAFAIFHLIQHAK
jgi:hypothetical protein